nr:PREDICTED: uncharacterized protein LOC100878763 isoform X1 [Megachile rotundata]
MFCDSLHIFLLPFFQKCNINLSVIPQFLELCVVIRDTDFDGMIDQAPHLILTICSLIKFENIVLNKKHIRLLLNIILNDWKIMANELPVLEKTTAQGNRLAYLYRVTLLTAVICFIYIPLINPTLDLIMPLNETRPKQQLYGVCYIFIDIDDHFTSVFLHLSWTAFVIVYNVAAVDSLYILIIHHVCGLFDVCGYQIEMALAENKVQYHQFKLCVITHHKALELVPITLNCKLSILLMRYSILGFSVTYKNVLRICSYCWWQ